MIPDFVEVHRRAVIGEHVLSKKERQAVGEKFRTLLQIPKESWANEDVRLIPGEPVVYRFNATPSLVVYFSVPAEGTFLIEDFANQEMLDHYFRKPAESTVPE